MCKKIIISLLIATLWGSSVALAYVYGGTNLDFTGYPQFNGYLPYNPTRTDLEIFINEADEYIKNCNNDVQRIYEARNNAIDTVNREIERYKYGY